jgi:choline transporter-like protein 2/4/5
MVKCCSKTSNAVEPFDGDDQGSTPMQRDRKCRDVLCTLIFVAFWGGMLLVAAIGLQNGKPERLLYGTDFQGNTCGVGSLASKKLMYERTQPYP